MSTVSVNASVIEAIPPDVLATIPAASPPPGVVPNFVHPDTLLPEIATTCSIFLAIATVCYSLRIYTKARVSRRWTWDDFTISLGFFIGIVLYGFFLNGCINGVIAEHLWDAHLGEVFSHQGMLSYYSNAVLSQPAFAFVKGSLFIQYFNFFHRLRWVRIAVWLGATVHCIFYSTVIVVAFVLASPRHGETWLQDVLSAHYLSSEKIAVPVGSFGLAMDIYLFVLPIPAIWKLHMSMSKKLGLIVVFTIGGLGIVASTASLAYRIKLQFNDFDADWRAAYVLICTVVEILAGVTASSMPSVMHFWKYFSKKFPLKTIFRPPTSTITRLLRRTKTQDDIISVREDFAVDPHIHQSSSDHEKPEDGPWDIRVTQDFVVERGA